MIQTQTKVQEVKNARNVSKSTATLKIENDLKLLIFMKKALIFTLITILLTYLTIQLVSCVEKYIEGEHELFKIFNSIMGKPLDRLD